jgi:hypothetical protein
MISPGQYVPAHVQTILPAPPQAMNGMSLQSCSPMQSMVSNMGFHQGYPIAQPGFAQDMQSNSTNSSANGSIVIPASPTSALFDVNAKWDHLFQGGGIFDMSSLFGFDSEFGHLTPPEFSVVTSIEVLIVA